MTDMQTREVAMAGIAGILLSLVIVMEACCFPTTLNLIIALAWLILITVVTGLVWSGSISYEVAPVILLMGCVISAFLCLPAILGIFISSGATNDIELPSETHAIDGGTITISGAWGHGPSGAYVFEVTCEGERNYNATIYTIHRKEDLEYAIQNNLACPLHKTVAVINKTQPTYSSWFWPEEDQMPYPVVVLDDGTYVPFWDIRPIRWEL